MKDSVSELPTFCLTCFQKYIFVYCCSCKMRNFVTWVGHHVENGRAKKKHHPTCRRSPTVPRLHQPNTKGRQEVASKSEEGQLFDTMALLHYICCSINVLNLMYSTFNFCDSFVLICVLPTPTGGLKSQPCSFCSLGGHLPYLLAVEHQKTKINTFDKLFKAHFVLN